MAQPRLNRVGDLDIDQVMSVQEFSWRIQQFGQVAIALFLAAALAGLFGRGPLSHAKVGDPAHLALEYSRFERRTQEATLTVLLGPQPSGVVRLWLDERFVAAQPFERVIPEPEGVALEEGRVVFSLRVAGERPTVWITIRPEAFGALRGRLGIVGGPEVSFVQFVYP